MPQPSITKICLKITCLKFYSNFPGANELTHYPLVAPCGDRHLRLLHSPSLVAIGLSVGYETWPPIGWHLPFVIGWSEDRLGLPSAPLHYGLKWPVGIPTAFQTSVTVLLHCPNGRQLPTVRAVQGDCERVYRHLDQHWLRLWLGAIRHQAIIWTNID